MFNVLIVDDSATARAYIARTLQIAEVPIQVLLEACNGREGLEALNNNWIDLVFTDLNMPVMGGAEMIEHMARDGLMESIPVVVVSSVGDKRRIEQLRHRGVTAFARKPVTPETVRDIVMAALGRENVH